MAYEDKAQAKLILPKKFINKAEQLNSRARLFQDKTKMMIYGLLLSFLCLSIGSIWFIKGS